MAEEVAGQAAAGGLVYKLEKLQPFGKGYRDIVNFEWPDTKRLVTEEVKSLKMNNEEWQINQSLNCETSNCVYMIECRKDSCRMRYIGETKRIMKFRLAEHRGYISNNDDTPTGEHFNSPGHSISDLSMTILLPQAMPFQTRLKYLQSLLLDKAD